MNRRQRRARPASEPKRTRLRELALEAQRRFHAIARTHPDLQRIAKEEVFLAVAVSDAATMALAVMAYPADPDHPFDMGDSLRQGIDRAASEGVSFSIALLLEPHQVVASLEIVGLPPVLLRGTATWMAKPLPAKMMRTVAVCDGEVAVFYQGDVIRLVENQC